MITENKLAIAEETVMDESEFSSAREFLDNQLYNDEPTEAEMETIPFGDPLPQQNNSRSLGEEALKPVPGQDENWYTYKSGKIWSPPLPISFLVARMANGVMDEKTYLRKMGVNNTPVGKELSLKKAMEAEDLLMPTPLSRDLSSRNLSGDLKSMSGHANTAANSIKTFAETIDTKDLKSLATVKKLLKVSKGLSRLSSGLGMLGAVLGVISLLSGEETDTDKILNAIKELGGKVDSLQDAMNSQFDKLKNTVELQNAKSQLAPHMATIRAVKELMRVYQNSAENSPTRKTAAEDLMAFGRTRIQIAVNGITSLAIGRDQATNIITAAYNESCGDIRVITELGACLYSSACFGIIADTLIGTLERIEANEDSATAAKNAEAYAKTFYADTHESIQIAWNDASDKCENDFVANMVQKMERDVFPTMNAATHENSVKNVRNILKTQWFWKDWMAIIYNPVGGFNNHGVTGWGYKSWYRKGVIGGQVNMIIKYLTKESGTSGAGWNTNVTLSVSNPDFDQLDGISNFFGGPSDPPFINKTYAAENVDWKDVRSAFNKIHGKISSPGMLWMCRRYQGVYMASTNSSRYTWKNGSKFTICIFR